MDCVGSMRGVLAVLIGILMIVYITGVVIITATINETYK